MLNKRRPGDTFTNHQNGELPLPLVGGATLPSSTLAGGSNSPLKRVPSRPPRNPARSSVLLSDESMIATGSAHPALSLQTQQPQLRDTKSKRPLTAPGIASSRSINTTAREETTPWELQTTDTAEEIVQIPELQTTEVSPTRMTHPTIKHPYNDHPRSLRSGGGFSPNHSPRSSRMVVSPTSSTLSLASLISASLSPPSVIFGRSRDPPQALSMSTGPISEVTPWELYPVPRRDSASASVKSTSTSGGVNTSKSTSWLSSGSNPRLQIPPLKFKRSVKTTGPVEEVTPWDLAPGPEEDGDWITPPSPTRSKFSSKFKSKADSKHSARPVAPPSSETLTTSVAVNVWDDYPVTPTPLRSPKMSRKSTSQVSEKSQESRYSNSVQMGAKSFRTGSKGGKGKKESKPPVSMGMVERQRSLPLTGPLEEVAPWEMHPVPAIEVGDEGENEKKLSTNLFGSRARSRSSLSLGLGSCGNGHGLSGMSTPALGLLIDVSNGSKRAGQTQTTGKGNLGGNYTHEDERSISSAAISRSSSKGPLSSGKVGGEKRVRTNSAAASSMSLDGFLSGEGEATNPSLVLSANQAVDEEAEDMKEFSLVGQQIGKERISTNHPTISASNLRSASSTHVPAVKAIQMVSSMSTSQVQEVTPWELCPVTPSPHRSASTRSEDKERRPSRLSTSSSTGKVLAELKKKKSATARNSGTATGSGGVSRVPSASGTSGSQPGVKSRDSGFTAGSGFPKGVLNAGSQTAPDPSNAPAHGHSTLPIAPVASTSSTSSAQSHGARSTTGKEKGPTASDLNLSKFSTADRTILEELKANILAREAQFVIKGIGHATVGGKKCPGKKYHPYSKEDVPYPRSYDREVVDLDVWETMFGLDLCKSLTWHIFETPPTKVLEIGCGTGTWILHAAKTWKNCHFVGLDIVPLHPNLQNVASPDMVSRITWVQHNFLDGLPFQNEEFDFVHIKRIALGVPEDKWDIFFEEVLRITKPGGAFEMIEEDLFFPGKPFDDDDDTSTLSSDDASILTRKASNSSSRQFRTTVNGEDTAHMTAGNRTPPGSPRMTTTEVVKNGDFRKKEPTGNHNPRNVNLVKTSKPKTVPFLLRSISHTTAVPPNPRDHTILEAIWHGMLEWRFVNMSPLSLLTTYLEYHFKDVRTHPPLLYAFPPLESNPCVERPDSVPQSEICDGPTYPPRSPNIPTIQRRFTDSTDLLNDDLRLSHEVLKHRSMYVALDETRSDALSPSNMSHLSKKTNNATHILPSRALNIDLRTLNLHLALRAKEIIACSEPMWEWVEDYQAKNQNNRKPRFRSDSIETALLGSTLMSGRDHDDLTKNFISEMTRDDFDQLLNYFQMDMQDRARVGHALEERFHWPAYQTEPPQDRKIFDDACQSYDEWLASETKRQMQLGSGHRSKFSAIAEGLVGTIAEASSENQTDPSFGHVSPRTTRLPTLPVTSQRLSRAMRVFVAWKASR